MRIDGRRVLVVGATGTVGGLAAERLTRLGASAAPAGRDRKRLAGASRALGGRPYHVFEAYDLGACEVLAPGPPTSWAVSTPSWSPWGWRVSEPPGTCPSPPPSTSWR